MTKISHFIFYILFAGAVIYDINLLSAEHPALQHFKRTYFLNHSEEFWFRQGNLIIDKDQALIFIVHEVAPGNRDPFAQPFSTCMCYLMCKTGSKIEWCYFDLVPRKYEGKISDFIKKYNLPPFRRCISPNLTPLDGPVAQRHAEMQRIINYF